MRTMSASDVSRRFSAVLDKAERGETIVITRGGRRIAVLSPAPATNGAALLKVLSEWGTADDPTFEDDLAAIRSTVTVGEDPWRA